MRVVWWSMNVGVAVLSVSFAVTPGGAWAKGLQSYRSGSSALSVPNESRSDATLSGAMRVGDEWMSRSAQRVGVARVSGAWSKKITLELGASFRGQSATRTLFDAGEVAREIPARAEQAVARMEGLRDRAEVRLKTELPAFARASYVYPWHMEIDPDRWEPRWLVEYVDASETAVWRAVIGPDLRLISHEKVSEGLAEGRGTAFPLGPLASSLASVTLQGLNGDGSLRSEELSITTGIEPRAFSPDLLFQFPLTDPRFDEVQAYFFIDQALRFFREKFGTPINSSISAKVNVGGPKSNAAFYFGKKIFLGAGDGVVYQGLVRDPSVVYHESAHALIDQIAGLPSQGEGGSLNEAFADFIAATLLDNPNVGEASYMQGPYRRTLLNHQRAPADLSGNLYGDSLVVSGTLWDIRRSLGMTKSSALALGALARLGEGSKLADFAPAVLQAATSRLSLEDQRAVAVILGDRGWGK